MKLVSQRVKKIKTVQEIVHGQELLLLLLFCLEKLHNIMSNASIVNNCKTKITITNLQIKYFNYSHTMDLKESKYFKKTYKADSRWILSISFHNIYMYSIHQKVRYI